MIDTISVSGKYMYAHGGYASTYIQDNGRFGVGNMRFNTNTQSLEVFDGSSWIHLNMPIATVGLNPEAESILDWAKQKRDEEIRFEKLAETNATVKDLLDQIKAKQEQLKMVEILLRNTDQTKEPVKLHSSP